MHPTVQNEVIKKWLCQHPQTCLRSQKSYCISISTPTSTNDAEKLRMSYWASYNCTDGPQNTYGGNECSISVVLDAGAHSAFSSVRVVIVYKEGERFKDVMINQCHDSDRLGFFWYPRKPIPEQLKRLHGRNLRSSRAESSTLIREAQRNGSDPSECLVCAFELVYCPDKACYKLVPWEETPGPQSSSSLSRPLIAFDQTWTLGGDRKAILFYLESGEHGFHDPDSMMCRCCTKIFLHCHEVRVIPANRTSRAFQTLPHHIIRRIVSHIVDLSPGWKRNLLSCALVQKSWLHVIDLFFETYGTPRAGIMGNPIHVARSLEYQRQRGSLLTAFQDECLSYFYNKRDEDSDSVAVELYSSVRTILSSGSTSIKKLQLHKSAFIKAADILKEMRAVSSFVLTPVYDFEVEDDEGKPLKPIHLWPELPRLFVSQIQEVCKEWKQLKIVRLVDWDEEHSTDSDLQDLSHKLTGPIEEIQLSNGVITGRQLCAFSSNTVLHVSLLRIRGLTNGDLLEFLLSISSSVEDIAIQDCEFNRPMGEEHAIEAALPRMKKLSGLNAKGEHFTCQVLTRKCGPLQKLKRSEYWRPSLGLRLSGNRRNPDPVSIVELPSAVETTYWGYISISLGEEAYDEEAALRAERIAERRGINFAAYQQ